MAEKRAIPRSLALKYQIAPRFELSAGKALIRSAQALPEAAVSELELLCGGYMECVLISPEEFRREFEEVYPDDRNAHHEGAKFRILQRNDGSNPAKADAEGAPIVDMVNDIISRAIQIGASDIHLEPRENAFALRYRLDGVLQEQPALPLEKMAAIISRVKIMADLDISERRRPQDGRIRVEGKGRAVDLRVSVIPTDFGEKAAIRILDKTQLRLNLGNLGLARSQAEIFKEALAEPNGIILVTGPTGSGKTTTLYAALNHIKSPYLNILTIEDPIEYNLDGVNQSQVKREVGYDFASALRVFLRQDPDVILVGEIRDLETAEIAIRASLTGHLVLSTLHTNDAPAAVTRLIDIGIEPYLVASSVKLVMAQRLVRLLCPYCKKEQSPSSEQLKKIGVEEPKNSAVFGPVGCPKCLKTGYIGRQAVFEIMPVSEGLEELIGQKTPAGKIRETALAEGVIPLKSAGWEKVANGLTSIDELLRIC